MSVRHHEQLFAHQQREMHLMQSFQVTHRSSALSYHDLSSAVSLSLTLPERPLHNIVIILDGNANGTYRAQHDGSMCVIAVPKLQTFIAHIFFL